MGGDGITTWPQLADIPAPVQEGLQRDFSIRRLGLLLEKLQKGESVNIPKDTEKMVSMVLAGFLSCFIKQPLFYL